MAREETAPPAVPHATKKEVVSPPTEETARKEKALVPESQKDAEGVLASKNSGQTSSSKPSAREKSTKPHAPLRPIEEGVPTPDDARTQSMADEEPLRNPLETYPLFPVKDGPNGPAFNE